MMLYKNPKRSTDKRVEDLLSRMTVQEKVSQLCCLWPLSLVGKQIPDEDLMKKYMCYGLGRMTQFANMLYQTEPKEVARFANSIQDFNINHTRLGIPVLFQNEAINGFICTKATSFPTTMNLAATWNPDLMEEMGKIIQKEMHAVGVRQALAPQLDITQDPRWGRVAETFGEDPYLTSCMGVSLTKGIQGETLTNGILATGKHFVGYGISQGGLNLAAIRIGEIELLENFIRPFEAAIKLADLQAVMAAYPEINGLPGNCNKKVLREILRKHLGFRGHVVSEGGGIDTLVTNFHVAKDLYEAAKLALEAGVDADTPNTKSYTKLVELIKNGQIEESLLNESVMRILTAKINLGLFENPYAKDEIYINDVYSDKKSREINKKITEESIILIKNENNLLPIEKSSCSIALIGPFANDMRVFFSNYSFPASVEMLMRLIQSKNEEGKEDNLGLNNVPEEDTSIVFGKILDEGNIENIIHQNYPYSKTLLEALNEFKPAETKIQYAKGCGINDQSTEEFEKAIQISKQSDLVIITLGDKSGWVDSTCGEGKDSTSLELPGIQQTLLEEIYKTRKPILLILFNGRPHTINWAMKNIPSILLVGNPGPWGGEVIAEALFGLINPGGKTTMTIPRSVGQIPIFYNHKTGSGYMDIDRNNVEGNLFSGGYQNEPRTPLIPFGFGLSYTKFLFSNLVINPKKVDLSMPLTISCTVENIGDKLGDEIVQLYIHDCEARVTRPVKELIGFRRITLKPKEKCLIEFIIKLNLLGFYNENGDFVVEPGRMNVMIGSSSENIHLMDSFEIIGEVENVLNKKSYISEAKATYLS